MKGVTLRKENLQGGEGSRGVGGGGMEMDGFSAERFVHWSRTGSVRERNQNPKVQEKKWGGSGSRSRVSSKWEKGKKKPWEWLGSEAPGAKRIIQENSRVGRKCRHFVEKPGVMEKVFGDRRGWGGFA